MSFQISNFPIVSDILLGCSDVPLDQRARCGSEGIDQFDCEKDPECCWEPSQLGFPVCFYNTFYVGTTPEASPTTTTSGNNSLI